jgi:hypothetical protein
MEREKYEVRVLPRHYWKIETIKSWQQQKKKCDVEGEVAVNEHTAQRWFKRFASGNLSSEGEQHPG